MSGSNADIISILVPILKKLKDADNNKNLKNIDNKRIRK